jgi:hypothetical protein
MSHNNLVAAICGALLLGASFAAQAQETSTARVASGAPRPLTIASQPEQAARQTVTVGAFQTGDAADSAALVDNMRASLADALTQDGRFAVTQTGARFRIDGEVTKQQANAAAEKLQDVSVEISLRVTDAAGRTVTNISAQGRGSANTGVAPNVFRDTAMGKASAEAFRQAVLKIAETTATAR